MYKNVGSKIVAMATVDTIIGMIASVVLGIWVGFILIGGFWGFIVFLLVTALGCFLAWVINLVLAGFGELVSSANALNATVQQMQQGNADTQSQKAHSYAKSPPMSTAPIFKDSAENTPSTSSLCEKCAKPFSKKLSDCPHCGFVRK